jgi:hypothetical protein
LSVVSGQLLVVSSSGAAVRTEAVIVIGNL